MRKVIRTFTPICRYFTRAQLHYWRHKQFPKELRNDFLMRWGQETLSGLGVALETLGQPPMQGPGLFVGNHISYLDIPILCSQVPVIFVAKAEIARWPLIGNAVRFLDMILVQRGSPMSRQKSALAIGNKIMEHQEKVAIFPAGTTSLDEDKVMWKKGAFHLAQKMQFPVQAFRLNYYPKRMAAYIDHDMLIPHLLQLSKQNVILASIEFAKPQLIQNLEQDMQAIKQWCNQAHPL